jgi:hypothetical protein
MGKKCEMVNLFFSLLLFFFILMIIYYVPNKEELSLLSGTAPITPLASKIAIDRRHALEAYEQTLGPDIHYAAYYSPYYSRLANNLEN